MAPRCAAWPARLNVSRLRVVHSPHDVCARWEASLPAPAAHQPLWELAATFDGALLTWGEGSMLLAMARCQAVGDTRAAAVWMARACDCARIATGRGSETSARYARLSEELRREASASAGGEAYAF